MLAGDSTVPILYHVERVRDGKSFCTRTVQARQRGRAIFTVTMSFTKDMGEEAAQREVHHAAAMPEGVRPPPEDYAEEVGRESPFESYRIEVTGDKDGPVETKKTRHWVRARGRISEAGGHQAHLSALAYVSDSYFIGTVSRIHQLWRFPFRAEDFGKLSPEVKNRVTKLLEFEGSGTIDDMVGRPAIGMMVSLDQ